MVQDAVEMEPPRKRTLSIGPVIAIVIVTIIISAGILLMLWDPAVKELSLVNPTDADSDGDTYYDSVRLAIVAVKDGVKGVDEEAGIRILHDGATVYAGKAKVGDDVSYVDIRYDQFVVGNGNYLIKASMGSARAEASYTVSFVAQNVTVGIEEFDDLVTGDYKAQVSVTPLFFPVSYGKGFIMEKYDKWYQFTLRIEDPSGEVNENTYRMSDLPGNYAEVFDLPGDLMGFYSASVTFENLLAKQGSPVRSLQGDDSPEEYINHPPAIEDITVKSKVQVNENFELTCRATDFDANGGLTSFTIDWGDTDSNGEFYIEEKNITGSPKTANGKFTHHYTKTGSYTITISVADNGPLGSKDPPIDEHIRLATQYRDITVKLI